MKLTNVTITPIDNDGNPIGTAVPLGNVSAQVTRYYPPWPCGFCQFYGPDEWCRAGYSSLHPWKVNCQMCRLIPGPREA